jgi:hypothetical protein
MGQHPTDPIPPSVPDTVLLIQCLPQFSSVLSPAQRRADPLANQAYSRQRLPAVNTRGIESYLRNDTCLARLTETSNSGVDLDFQSYIKL